MKIAAISDTHDYHSSLNIKPCDVLIHAGDATSIGTKVQLERFWSWLAYQPAKYKIWVPGNHDIGAEKGWRPPASTDIITLVDEGVMIDNVKFWGSPWTPEFYNWAFMLKRGPEIAAKWALIPEDTDVLITHGPPLGILDNGKGCVDLYNRTTQLKLKLHVFGHIHETYGRRRIGDTWFINAAQAGRKVWQEETFDK